MKIFNSQLRRRHFIKTGLIFVPAIAKAQLLINPYSFASSVVNAEVADWIARVQGRGSDVGSAQRGYVDTFVSALKTASIFTKMKRIGVYVGNDLAALEAPLVNTWGATEDTLTNFDSGDYSESTGLTGNGSDEYIDTGLNPQTIGLDTYDWHMSVYNRTASNAATVAMGCQSGAGNVTYLLIAYSGTSYWNAWSTTNQISASDSNGVGHYMGSNRSSSDREFYKNGATLVSDNSDGGGNLANASLFVHALNASGSPSQPTARALSFYSVGLELNDTEAGDFYNAVQALQTSLGRNV